MRPRSAAAREAVLTATTALLADAGVEGLHIEQVSARSGVAKTTIYRHWPTKADLVVDAISSCVVPVATPNSGDLRRDLIEVVVGMRDALVASGLIDLVPSLLAAARNDPELAALHERLGQDRDTPVRTVLELAQLRRALPDEIDLDRAAELLVGPLLLRLLFTHEPPTDDHVAFVVDTVLAGLRAEASVPAGLSDPAA
jgi:AcrR family transcriptional regulator